MSPRTEHAQYVCISRPKEKLWGSCVWLELGQEGEGVGDEAGGGREEEQPAARVGKWIFLRCPVQAQLSEEARSCESKPGLPGLYKDSVVKVENTAFYLTFC